MLYIKNQVFINKRSGRIVLIKKTNLTTVYFLDGSGFEKTLYWFEKEKIDFFKNFECLFG